MYDQDISRRNPGLVVFLLDRSDSMKQQWGNSSASMADGAAQALNDVLLELCFRSQGEPGRARHYFDVGVFGYGVCPVAGGEGVEPALGGVLAGRPIVPLPDLRDNPVAVVQMPSADVGAPASRVPVWVQPAHGYRTPMCQAVAVAGEHVYRWAADHPKSHPPIIINITDGWVSDSPFDGADLAEWARRLTNVQTNDGPALLFNIFLSPEPGSGVLFPTAEDGLPAPGPDLFRISSPLPVKMVANAAAVGAPVVSGSRGFAFNADSKMLVRFLEIGTRIDIRD